MNKQDMNILAVRKRIEIGAIEYIASVTAINKEYIAEFLKLADVTPNTLANSLAHNDGMNPTDLVNHIYCDPSNFKKNVAIMNKGDK